MPRFALLLFLSAGALAVHGATAVLDGRKIHYQAAGQGKAVVLVHGWTCDHTFWAGQAPELARHYRVLALDLPGHGRSDPAPDYTMERFARSVEAVMRAERIQRATLAGHSMGGAVLLAFTRLFPGKAERLVLVDAAVMEADEAARYSNYYQRFIGEAGKAERRKFVESMYTPATSAEARAKILGVMLAAPEPVAVGAMKEMLQPAFWAPGEVGIPTLAVVANPKELSEEALRRRYPRLTYRVMPGTGHFLMMEKPGEFNALLLEWLAAR